MDCSEITNLLSNIKADASNLNASLIERNISNALSIRDRLKYLFSGELQEYIDSFYRFPDQEHYSREAIRIFRKVQNQKLTRKELVFIYDTEDNIKKYNLRTTAEIRLSRTYLDPYEDVPIIFGCQQNEVAWGSDELNHRTKVYIGPLFDDFFKYYKHYPNLEHVYADFFTSGKVKIEKLSIHVENIEQLREGLMGGNNFLLERANETIENAFTPLGPTEIQLVKIALKSLCFASVHPDIKSITKRAEKTGLKPCAVSVLPALLQTYEGFQGKGRLCNIVLDQIDDRCNINRIFSMDELGDELQDSKHIDEEFVSPNATYDLEQVFVFCLQ